MDGPDLVDEVLDFAIAREIEANQFYVELAGRMEEPAMRKVFENFAKEELGHKAKLEALKAGKAVPLGGKIADLKIADYVVAAEAQPDMNYKDALVLAMQKEKASYRLYMDLAGVVRDQSQREIFLRLAQEEAKHKMRFEVEYDEVVLKED